MADYGKEQQCALEMAQKVHDVTRSYFGKNFFPRQQAPTLDSVLAKEKQRAIAFVETAAQDAALEILHRAFPRDRVFANKETPVLGKFVNNAGEREWYLDTLDGGWNYIEANEQFGMTAGFREKGAFVLSVLEFPTLDTRYVATKDGLHKFSAQHPKGERVSVKDPAGLTSFDLIHLGSGVPGGVVDALELLGDMSFKKSRRPTTLRVIDVLDGNANAYLTYQSTIYDMGPVSFAVQAAGGAFVDLAGKQPTWQSVKRNEQERIILQEYAILGPKKYSSLLAERVSQIIDVADKE